ncbi:MAG: hypothetical protein V7K34_23195 [Nostoc sp.]
MKDQKKLAEQLKNRAIDSTLDGAKSRYQTVTETMQRFANDYSLLLPMLPKYQTNEDLYQFKMKLHRIGLQE